MSDEINEPVISAQRLTPESHLKHGAKSPLDSNAERYHLAAAQAEALTRMLPVLNRIARALEDVVAEMRTRTDG